MAWLELTVITLYALFLVFIFVYSLSQLDILLKFKKAKKKSLNAPFSSDLKGKVTIQLPVFNEKYVIERLINAVCNFDYPKDQLQIQVLDDSTDETKDLIEKIVAQKQAEGFEIEHIHRTNRDGFKAGALRDAMPFVKGEFIAIFDADFIPPKDFLQKTVGYFTNPKVGVVQTPWRHLNHDYSMLTSLQAFGLNAHFSVEQKGRNAAGHFINFNGTGGIWRKSCIEDAGGWSPSTLTEDLDLSYRAQLKGWQFLFVDNIGSPAELPANMKALRTQQFRWTKGAAECARKNLGKVLTSNLPFSTKFHATFHLLNSFIFVCLAATAILSVPVMWFKPHWPQLQPLFMIGGLFIFSFLLLGVYYWNAAKENALFIPTHQKKFFAYFPLFLSFTMGLSIHNGIGVIEGYLGKKSPFLRTPKFNIVTKKDTWKGKGYLTAKLSPISFIEGLLSLYFLFALLLGVYLKDFGLFPVHLMLFLGFGAIFSYSLIHAQNQYMLENRKFRFTDFFFPFLFFAICWVVEFFEYSGTINFGKFGLYPRRIENFYGILTSPFIHDDWEHLINNSIPMFLLGIAIFYFYREVAWKLYLGAILITGLWVWVFARPSYHIGASGMVYSFASFVFFSGIFRKYYRLIALSLLVVFLYGSMIWGIFPNDYRISWESHLMGGLSGLLLAYFYRKIGPSPKKYDWEDEDEEDEDQDFFNQIEKEKIVINYTYKPKGD